MSIQNKLIPIFISLVAGIILSTQVSYADTNQSKPCGSEKINCMPNEQCINGKCVTPNILQIVIDFIWKLYR